MKSQSPQKITETYKHSVNFITPIRNRHISQLSTGKNLLRSTPNEVQQLNRELIPKIQQRLLEKQKLLETPSNYYQDYGYLKKGTSNNYSSILFKSGYDQQEEIKRLNKENQNLKEIIKKQQEKLQEFLEMGHILEQNRLLQEKVERLEKAIQLENNKEQRQKMENE